MAKLSGIVLEKFHRDSEVLKAKIRGILNDCDEEAPISNAEIEAELIETFGSLEAAEVAAAEAFALASHGKDAKACKY